MASAIHIGAKNSQQRDKLKDRAKDESISTPMLIFTDAEARDDLYKLDKGSNVNPVLKSKAADSGATTQITRKKPHLADLVLQSPTMSAFRPREHVHRSHTGGASYSTTGIGVALGSPSQSPWTYGNPSGSSSSLDTRGPSPLSTSVPSPNLALEEGLRDRGKWKMFGGFFAKKPTSHPVTPGTPFYKAQYPASALQNQHPSVAGSGALPKHRRVASRSLDNIHSSTTGKSTSTVWTPVQLPRKSSMTHKASTPPATRIRSPTPPPKDYPAKQAQFLPSAMAAQPLILGSETSSSGFLNSKPETKPSLLEIDIPDVQMERYSIMFSDVLKPRQSLLARRQAQLPQLKVLDPTKEEEHPYANPHIAVRRATVPSPTYSLFPLPPSRKGPPTPNPPIPKPLVRSATAPPATPAGTISSRPLYPQRQDSRANTTLYSPSQSSDTPASLHDQWRLDLSPVSTVPSEQDDTGIAHGEMHTMYIQSSDSGSESELEDRSELELAKESNIPSRKPKPPLPPSTSHLPARPNEHKRAHETQNSLPRGSSLPRKTMPIPTIRRQRSVSNQQPDHTTDGFRQIVQPNPLKSSPATATEISVARKLSLSRRQQMLVPIVPKPVQQPQQPKLINPDDLPEVTDTGRKRSESRPRERSQYIVLDSIELG